ncbi:MAG: tetratricopeptide repeat protein [Pseudomonadota bacterium]
MAGFKAARAGAIAGILCLGLAACGTGGQNDTRIDPGDPFAPGVATRGESVDQMLVAHRLMAAREYELAIDAFSRATLSEGMNVEILAGMGSANLGLGRLDTAERLLRRALEKDEERPEVWNNLGVVMLEKGELGQAEQMFKRAYALDNGQSDSIRDNLRLVLAKSEEYQYSTEQEHDYKLVRRGSSDYLIRPTPD